MYEYYYTNDGEDKIKIEEWFDPSGNMFERKGK
jgi:hypothetical protein